MFPHNILNTTTNPSSNMNLNLSEGSPLNSTFYNDAGQVIYRVETPSGLGSRTSTITRVIPNNVEPKKGREVNMQDRFGFLAQVEHNPISSSVLRFPGGEIPTKEYFRREGWGWYGRYVDVPSCTGHKG